MGYRVAHRTTSGAKPRRPPTLSSRTPQQREPARHVGHEPAFEILLVWASALGERHERSFARECAIVGSALTGYQAGAVVDASVAFSGRLDVVREADVVFSLGVHRRRGEGHPDRRSTPYQRGRHARHHAIRRWLHAVVGKWPAGELPRLGFLLRRDANMFAFHKDAATVVSCRQTRVGWALLLGGDCKPSERTRARPRTASCPSPRSRAARSA